jgi:RelB Antitoxin alpha helical domain
MAISSENYPFVKEFIVDTIGEVDKVVMDLSDYQRLLEFLVEEGLYRAILEVQDETSLLLNEALQELERE